MRKFSWKNFTKFLVVSITVLIFFWLLWSVVDIDLHNLNPSDKPSKYNAWVIYSDILQNAVERSKSK